MAKSKANNKLQNVKAIKEMLAGRHKTQSRKTFGFTKKKEILDKDILEKSKDGTPKVWIETNPATGTQVKVTKHDGFTSRQPVNSILDEVNKIVRMPEECPKCGSKMYEKESRLNKKFWKINQTCFGCVIELETKLRAEEK